MENVTVAGLKELNLKMVHIERDLNDIAKSLSALTKIMNRRFPDVRLELNSNKEDDDEM